jgi:hypothetical protein
MDDSNDCPFMDDYSPDEQVEPLHPLPCPVTQAWAQFDRLVRDQPRQHAQPANRRGLDRDRTSASSACVGRKPRKSSETCRFAPGHREPPGDMRFDLRAKSEDEAPAGDR